MGDAGHLLAAAAAATVLLLDLRRPALPLLTWKHGAWTMDACTRTWPISTVRV